MHTWIRDSAGDERRPQALGSSTTWDGLEKKPLADKRFPTIPIAIWNTVDLEWRHSADLIKGFPSRFEPISAGPIGRRASYFAEWRALSQSIGGHRRLLNRSGRFEDLYLRAPVTWGGALWVTAGQFRTLTQVDVSLRLSLSEPLVFSSNVPGRRAPTARLTSLRAFSRPAGSLPYASSIGPAARSPRPTDGLPPPRFPSPGSSRFRLPILPASNSRAGRRKFFWKPFDNRASRPWVVMPSSAATVEGSSAGSRPTMVLVRFATETI